MPHPSASRAVALLPVLAAWLLLPLAAPAPTAANAAPPQVPGDAVGEPAPELVDVVIVSEALVIDMRPLATSTDLARVEATYRLRNDGASRQIKLVFVADALAGSGGTAVTLDGQPLPHQTSPTDRLPWQPPRTTPGLGGGSIGYFTKAGQGLLFSLTVPGGEHELRVSYPARPAMNAAHGPTRVWQLGYVLSPARQWGGFGTLDVKVHVPAGWAAATEPRLQREGDTLRGTFNGIPADTLGVSAQAPAPPVGLLQMAVFAGVVGGGLLLARVAGRALARRGRGARWMLPLSLLYGLIAPVIIFAGVAWAGELVDAGQRSWGYEPGLIIAFLGMPFVVVGMVVAMQIVAAVGGSSVLSARRSAHRG